MDKTSQSDLAVLVAAVAGVALAAIAQSARRADDASGAAGAAYAPMIVPSFLAATTLARRGGKMTGLYPERTLLLAAAAFTFGAGIVLASNAVGGFLPKTE
jgi:hypothetical protein